VVGREVVRPAGRPTWRGASRDGCWEGGGGAERHMEPGIAGIPWIATGGRAAHVRQIPPGQATPALLLRFHTCVLLRKTIA
jgi:hypothetical protein